MDSPLQTRRAPRCRERRKGAELIEFTLTLIPILMIIAALADVSWMIWAKSTLQRAVRLGVRKAVTLTASDVPAGIGIIEYTTAYVKANSMGLLTATDKAATIKIQFFDGTNPSTEVTSSANGNQQKNVIVVSVQNYPLLPLVARAFLGPPSQAGSAGYVSVSAADLIEPSNSVPPMHSN
jgi:Flp pilus assembly protein TadG